MSQLTIQQITDQGLQPVLAAAEAGGDSFQSQGRVFIYIANGDSSEHTLTVPSQWKESELKPGTQKENLIVAVPAGEDRFVGPLDAKAFTDDAGLVQLTYDDVTSVTVAVVRL